MATYKDILLLVDKVSQPLKKIQKSMQEAQKPMSKIRERIQKVGNSFKNLANKAKLAGSSMQKWGNKITGVVSKLGLSITGFTGAVGMAFNRVQGWFSQTAEYGDRIDKMSQKIGMSAKNFQEWDFIMSQNGGNVESLKMGFKTLANQLNAVKKGSKDSVSTFRALGIRITDTKGRLRDQNDVFNDAVKALQRMQNPTQKAIYGNKLFGRSFIEMKPLLNQSAEAIENLRKQAQDTIISQEDIENAVKYTDAMDKFNRIFQAKMAPIITRLMPKVLEIMDKILQRSDILEKLIGWIVVLTDKIVAMVDWFMNLNSFQKKLVIGFGLFLAAIGPVISGLGSIVMILGSFGVTATVAAEAIGGFVVATAPWAAAIIGIIGLVYSLVKAIQILVGWFQHLKNMKISSINAGFDTKQLDKLSKLQASMGDKAFTAKYGKDVNKKVTNYRKTQNTTTNTYNTFSGNITLSKDNQLNGLLLGALNTAN
nr:MAG TPA: tail tape measure [Caudoviricetes sp.]